jgi:hypothetical protein
MAEQLLGAHLVSNAGAKLDDDLARGALSDDDAAAARAEFRSLAKLIPSRGSPRAPVASWFRPFPGAAATAYVVT